MKIYLDMNIYNRPFDDQSQDGVQITNEKKDYMKLQDELFKGMDVNELYERAKKYQEKTGR